MDMQDCWSFTYCFSWTLELSLKCNQLKSLFYSYYFGRCSSTLSQLIPLCYSWRKCTHYSDKLHDFWSPFLDVIRMFQLLSSHSWTLNYFVHRMLSCKLWSMALNRESGPVRITDHTPLVTWPVFVTQPTYKAPVNLGLNKFKCSD